MALSDYPRQVVEQNFVNLVEIAKASENQAILIPTLLIVFIRQLYDTSPGTYWGRMVDQLTEIIRDENDHDAVYTDIYSMATTGEIANNTVYYTADGKEV